MRVLLPWSLLAGLVLALHNRGSDSLQTFQTEFDLHDRKDVDQRYERLQSWPSPDLETRQSTLQRRALPRKGIVRSPSAPNLGHETALQLSRAKNQEFPQGLSLKTKTHANVAVPGSHVSSYHTPFNSPPGSLNSSPRGSMSEHSSRIASFQRQHSGSSTNADSSSVTPSTQTTGSLDKIPTGQAVKPDPQSTASKKPAEKGIASKIGEQLLWIQNNPAKAMRMGTSMAANAASGGAAIAAAYHNVPGAACLAIGSAAIKIGIDCYDSRDKVQTWHKQKGIDPKESVEATKRMVNAAKKPAYGLWRTVSKTLSSQQSSEKPWPVENLPIKRRSIGY